jgi:hypothetical protein
MLKILGIIFKTHFKHVYRTCLKKRHLKVYTGKGKALFLTINETPKLGRPLFWGSQCLTRYNIYIQNRYFGYAEKKTENPQALNAFPDKGTSLNTADILLRHCWLLHCCRLIIVTYCFHSTVNARTFEN